MSGWVGVGMSGYLIIALFSCVLCINHDVFHLIFILFGEFSAENLCILLFYHVFVVHVLYGILPRWHLTCT